MSAHYPLKLIKFKSYKIIYNTFFVITKVGPCMLVFVSVYCPSIVFKNLSTPLLSSHL